MVRPSEWVVYVIEAGWLRGDISDIRCSMISRCYALLLPLAVGKEAVYTLKADGFDSLMMHQEGRVKSHAMFVSSGRHENLCQPKRGWCMRSRWFLENRKSSWASHQT
jgi:hypothetical protein